MEKHVDGAIGTSDLCEWQETSKVYRQIHILYISCPALRQMQSHPNGYIFRSRIAKARCAGYTPRRIREWRKNEVMSICMEDVSGLLRRVITIQIRTFPGENSSMILRIATRTDRERVDLHLKVDFS